MTWGEALSRQADRQPDLVVFSFYPDDADEPATLTYRELERRARAIAAMLTARGLRGRPALLVLRPGLDYVATFFGCMYAGVVAVPAYPVTSHPRSLDRLIGMVRDCGADTIVTTATVAARTRDRLAAVMSAPPALATVEAAQLSAADDWPEPRLADSDVAFLQYTSGSTTAPRGVVLSHANLLANTALIRRMFRLGRDTRAVSWLPMYHDMGLIGSVLGTVRCGGTCALMTPAGFVRNPRRWLELITITRATVSGGPNFAYDMCVRDATDELVGALDLSCWQVAFNGAEPVRATTMSSFAERFGPAGFRPAAFLPCYGLAEASLLVAGGPVSGGVRVRPAPREAGGGGAATEIVSSGTIPDGVDLEIVSPDLRVPVPAGEVGEIWIRGDSVASGYWGGADQSGAVFGARLAGTSGPRYLRTGDLGFVADRELYVTGRIKDLVIIRGRNHYPQDIEATAQSCDAALATVGGAAFAVTTGESDQLIVVHEVRRGGEVDGLAGRIALRVAQVHEIRPAVIVLIRAGTLPRTSSGKVARFACRAAYLDGTLTEIARHSDAAAPALDPAAPARAEDTIEAVLPVTSASAARHLTELLAACLGCGADQVPQDRPFLELGLDSLDAVRLRHKIELGYGVALSDEDVLPVTVADLADLIAGTATASASTATASCSPAAGSEGTALAAAENGAPAGALDQDPSHNQAGLWFLHQLAPASNAYHLRIVADASGPIEVEALRAALGQVVARHPALRTVFPEVDGGPVQRVRPDLPPELSEVDAAGWSDAAVDAAAAEIADRPFDLASGPLLRAAVLRRGTRAARLVLAAHHLICDLWSVQVLLDELGDGYAAQLAGTPAPSLPSPLGYPAACARQALRLCSNEGDRLWEYWRSELAGASVVVNLPTDHARPAVSRFRGGACRFQISAATTARLGLLARDHSTTLYTVLLCAYRVLLFRHTGQRDVLIGSPVHGRAHPDEADAVGPFVNTAVMRGAIDPSETFGDLLRRAAPQVRRALSHAWMPLALLVAKTRAPREANRSPLVQTLFTFQRSGRAHADALTGFALGDPSAELAIGPLRLRPAATPAASAQFDLQLTFAPVGDTLAGLLQFDADLFEASTADRIAGHLTRLLDAIAADETTPLARLELLTDQEQQWLLHGINDTAAEPARAALPQLIAAQAAKTPHAASVVYDDRSEPSTADVSAAYPALTYLELDQAANRLAHLLIRHGVTPEQVVGVHLRRHPSIVVAMLAVLRAGAAYLPIDPDLPPARIAFMLEDSAVATIVTTAELAATLPAHRAEALCLDRLAETLGAESPRQPAVRPLPEQVCYVLYTSGSTGRPKGVEVRYGALGNFLTAMTRLLGSAASGRLLAVTTISFDISGLELYLPLINGGIVHLLSKRAAADGTQLRRRLDSGAFTMMQATPGTWHLLCDAGWRPSAGLTVLCGGEALPAALADVLAASGTAWNMYGPTETTIWSTGARLGPPGQGPVSIGTPIDNTHVYVVDDAMRLVPAGVAGELLIGGAGLARGYRKRPGLTAAAFVPDPFSGRAGSRLYRTGDIARITATGAVEALGRRDHQVKVNGHRIELGEVETALERHPLVHRAIAGTISYAPGEAALVAYVQPVSRGDDAAFDPHQASATVRTALRQELPGYLVPTQIVWVSAFPVSPTGKIDRTALRPPAAAAEPPVPPSTPDQVALASLAADLLGLNEVSVTANFFDLGAHSLLISRFVSRARESCGVELTLSEVFTNPTIADLAELVSAHRRAGLISAAGPGRVRADRSAYAVTSASGPAPRTVTAIRRLHQRSDD